MPGLSEGGDIEDWYEMQVGEDDESMRETIQMMIDSSEPREPQAEFRQPSRGGGRGSQASEIVRFCEDMELSHDEMNRPYATFVVDGHRETKRVDTATFRSLLRGRYFRETETVPSDQALSEACELLSARAIHDGPERQVHLRVANDNDAIWLDLGDDQWRTVRIARYGWEVVNDPPVLFQRTNAVQALPEPQRGGTLAELGNLLGIHRESWILIASWLVASLRPRGPYPILFLHGEQGSGKSTAARMLRSLIDPNTALLRSVPQGERDFIISAENSWILGLDNLSHISQWLSDTLCRLATDGGFATRKLYENEEEVIFNVCRPALITSIANVATRSDLLDRSLVVTLPAIGEGSRRTEAELWEEFNSKRALFLGALLDAVSVGMRREAELSLPGLPRMADFAKWAVACEPGLGFAEGAVLQALTDNTAVTNSIGLESSPVANALLRMIRPGRTWSGTADELLQQLNSVGRDSQRGREAWPKSPRGLSGILTQLAPNLRAEGIEISRSRESGGNRRRIITITRSEE